MYGTFLWNQMVWLISISIRNKKLFIESWDLHNQSFKDEIYNYEIEWFYEVFDANFQKFITLEAKFLKEYAVATDFFVCDVLSLQEVLRIPEMYFLLYNLGFEIYFQWMVDQISNLSDKEKQNPNVIKILQLGYQADSEYIIEYPELMLLLCPTA